MSRLTTIASRLLGVGSLGFAAWELFAPRSLAELMGWNTDAARWLGVRELAVAGILLVGPPRLGLALGAASDFSDALATAQDRPAVSIGAAVSSVVALGLAARGRGHRR